MDEQTRLLALAQLKNGKTPTETSELMGISYATALKLRRELLEAEKNDTILELFNLNDAALDILLESIKRQLTPAIEAFGIGELIDKETVLLANGITGAKLLKEDLQTAASALVNKIKVAALAANNADTLLSLAEALCKLQIAFKPSGMDLPAPTSFEKHLRH